MGRVVRFEFFTSFYVYLPFTNACFPCPLVMTDVMPKETMIEKAIGFLYFFEK